MEVVVNASSSVSSGSFGAGYLDPLSLLLDPKLPIPAPDSDTAGAEPFEDSFFWKDRTVSPAASGCGVSFLAPASMPGLNFPVSASPVSALPAVHPGQFPDLTSSQFLTGAEESALGLKKRKICSGPSSSKFQSKGDQLQIEQLQKELENLKRNIAQKDKENERLLNLNKELTVSLARSNARITTPEIEKKESSEKIEKFLQDRQQLEKQIVAYQINLKQITEENSALKIKITTLESQLADCVKKLQDLEKMIGEVHKTFQNSLNATQIQMHFQKKGI
jgi:cell division protein FtsB